MQPTKARDIGDGLRGRRGHHGQRAHARACGPAPACSPAARVNCSARSQSDGWGTDEVAGLALAVLCNGYLTNQIIAIDGGIYPR
jgi:hypothetical protein